MLWGVDSSTPTSPAATAQRRVTYVISHSLLNCTSSHLHSVSHRGLLLYHSSSYSAPRPPGATLHIESEEPDELSSPPPPPLEPFEINQPPPPPLEPFPRSGEAMAATAGGESRARYGEPSLLRARAA